MTLCVVNLSSAKEVIEVVRISRSGHSMLINKGDLDGIKLGVRGYFIRQTGSVDKPKLEKVAWGEVVKVRDNESLWLLHLVNNKKLLKTRPKLVLIPTNELLKGRRDFNVLNKRRILTRGTTKKDLAYEKSRGISKDHIYKEKKYIEKDNIQREKLTVKEDIKVTSYDNWAKRKQLQYIDDYVAEIETEFVLPGKKTGLAKEISDENKIDISNSLIDSHVSKTNKLKYGLKGLYADSAEPNDGSNLNKKVSVSNVYEQSKEKRQRKKILRPEVYHKLDRDGDMWSADFSDKQLSRYLVKTGIAEEEIKRSEALYEKSGNELVFAYSSQLIGTANSQDPNHQSKNYSLLIGYEYHLMRSTQSMKNFTVFAFMENGVGHYDLGNEINGRFTEGSYGAIFNWYFYNNAASLDHYMWYLGLGIRRGSADVTSSFLSKDYQYQITGFPSFHLGLKYRMRANEAYEDDIPIGLGFYGRLSSEFLNLTSVSTVNSSDGIDGSISYNDIKLVLGLSVYF
jgi:hypothetical protein